MPQHRQCEEYAERRLLLAVPSMILGFVSFALIGIGGSHGRSRLLVEIGIAGLITCVVFVVVMIAWQNRHFRCPQCGNIIPVHYVSYDHGRRSTVEFICQRCDIVWHTGVIT